MLRGMLGIRKTRSPLFSQYAIAGVAHVVRVGASIVSAYCATKFAIRGLTQAAGMISPSPSPCP